MRRGEAQQFSDSFHVRSIFRRTFFQHQAKLFPEGLVFFRIVLRQFFQHLQRTFGQGVAQVTGDGAVLKNFTGDVQRQIVGVYQATHKAQVVRHELLGVVHDEDALHVQLQAVLVIAVPHVPWRLRRDVQQAGVLLFPFHTVVAPGQRIGEVVGDVLVKLVVLVVFNFSFITRPQPAPC